MSNRELPDDAFSPEFPKAMGRPANAALLSQGITTLAQVAARNEQELLAVHGMGPKAIAVLRAELQKYGLRLED